MFLQFLHPTETIIDGAGVNALVRCRILVYLI